MNKISSVLLSLCLMCTGTLAFSMDSMDKNGAMEKSTMSKEVMKKEPMNKEGAMMKAKPKKMQKQNDKMEQGSKMEHGAGMSMEPKK
jgi:pentapeptide MXKDX repeat protein